MRSTNIGVSTAYSAMPFIHRSQTMPAYAVKILASNGTGLGRLRLGNNYFFIDQRTNEHYTGKLISINHTEVDVAVFDLHTRSLSGIKTLNSESTIIYEINEKLIRKNPMDTIEFSSSDSPDDEALKLGVLIDERNYDVSSRSCTAKRLTFKKSEHKSDPPMLHFLDGSTRGVNIPIHQHGSVRLTLVL